MDTLCSAQKQTNFAKTLIQDILIFNWNDSTQLEDWLVDIETAGNQSAENRTKHAQSKSKGLTHTLITQAFNSGQCWGDIKDFLHLKLCNSDIHTSVSHFMETQQKEKESLAVYIHHFKRKAVRCNTATIRIFVKGLRNAHTIATSVYKKGPQTLACAIGQAAQQLKATLIPSSTVNVMPHEEGHCFQCQVSGHIAHHCPNVHCFDCDEYGYIVVDCLYWIPPSGTPAHHHRLNSHTRHCTRSTSHHCHQDRYRHNRSRLKSCSCRYDSHSHHAPYRGYSRSHHGDSRCHHTSTPQCPYTSTYCSCCDIPHCRLSSHRSSSTYSQDQNRWQSHSASKPSKKPLPKSSMHPSRTQDKSHDKRHPRVKIDDPQTDFYSSDDNLKNSEDDPDHLN